MTETGNVEPVPMEIQGPSEAVEKENDTQNVQIDQEPGSKRKRVDGDEENEDGSATKKANLAVDDTPSTNVDTETLNEEGKGKEENNIDASNNKGDNNTTESSTLNTTTSQTGVPPTSSSTIIAPNFPPVRGMDQFNAYAGEVKEIMLCPQNVVGRVIGKSGETIKDLQVRARCRIQINQNLPEGQPREIIIESDAQSKIEEAKSMIKVVMENGPEGLHSMPLTDNTITMDCPFQLVGRVIGKGGDTIRDLQKRTGARIQVDQNYPPDQPRKVQVSGTDSQVAFAKKLISCAMEYGPMSVEYAKASLAPQSQGTISQQEIDCQRAFIARVIGKKGETLKKLEQMTGAKIVIDQGSRQDLPESDQCKITILSTSKENLQHTSGLVIDVMRNGPGRLNPNDRGPPSRGGQMGHHYGGGGGYGGSSSYYGGQPPRGYGQSNMYQQNAYGNQNAGYGQHGGRYNQNQAHGGYNQGHTPNYHGQYGAGGTYNQQTPHYGQHSQQTPRGPPMPAPAPSSEWIKYETDQGIPYWYNTRTNTTQWENPGV